MTKPFQSRSGFSARRDETASGGGGRMTKPFQSRSGFSARRDDSARCLRV